MRSSVFPFRMTVLFIIVLLATTTNAQIQKGTDIDGEASGDGSGSAVCMPDPNTLAIGAPKNDINGVNCGHVRIFSWNGNAWVQKGQDINGQTPNDWLGAALSMPDANTVAIGARNNAGNGNNAGHVRVYSWDGNTWVQKGPYINGEAGDHAGWSVSMPDASTVAVGAYTNDSNGTDAGCVRIYGWNGNTWLQKGPDILGEAAGDRSGWSVCMPDAGVVAIGAPYNSGFMNQAGHVRVFAWTGSAWVQKGTDFDGEAQLEKSGHSVSMPDVNTVAIGASNDLQPGLYGSVRIYSWDGNAWVQKGSTITGEAINDVSGYSVSMPNSNTVAIGAPFNDNNGVNAGYTRVFKWNGSAWVQKCLEIVGEATDDRSGYSVSMPDANTVAIGAPNNDGSSSNAGQVRVYTLQGDVGIPQGGMEKVTVIHPNPSDGQINIDLANDYKSIIVTVRNEAGQEVFTKPFTNSKKLHIALPDEAGLYLLEINADGQKGVMKVVRE